MLAYTPSKAAWKWFAFCAVIVAIASFAYVWNRHRLVTTQLRVYGKTSALTRGSVEDDIKNSKFDLFGKHAAVSRYIVHLDAPADVRWKEIAEVHASDITKAVSFVDDFLSEASLQFSGRTQMLRSKIKQILAQQQQRHQTSTHSVAISRGYKGAAATPLLVKENESPSETSPGLAYDLTELQAISRISGVEIGTLAVLQLLIEMKSVSTAVIAVASVPSSAQNASKTDGSDTLLVHGRTFDSDVDFLRSLSIEIEFRRNNETVFFASSWAGYIGVLSGVRPGAFSVSYNQRYRNGGSQIASSLADHLKNIAAGEWAAGTLLRRMLETEQDFPNYSSAVKALSNLPLAGPAYFSVAGTRAPDAVLLTRDRRALLHSVILASPHLSSPASSPQSESLIPHTAASEPVLALIEAQALAAPSSAEDSGLREHSSLDLTDTPPQPSPPEIEAASAPLGLSSADDLGLASAPSHFETEDSQFAIVSTNIDPWDQDQDHDVMQSIARKAKAVEMLEQKYDFILPSAEALWGVLSAHPIMSEGTLSLAVMHAAAYPCDRLDRELQDTCGFIHTRSAVGVGL